MLPDRREPYSDVLLPSTVRAVAGPELYRGTCIPVNAPVRKAELYDLVPFGSDGSVLLPAVSLAFLHQKKSFFRTFRRSPIELNQPMVA